MFFHFGYTPYIAIIGDIKNSKKIPDRKRVQEKLNRTLETINQKYKADISSEFLITLGDEFQGLLCNGTNAMNIILEIERNMYPVKIRFGIGVGEIATAIRKMAIGADGPGYYNARDAIEYLKQKEKKRKSAKADIRIELDEENQATSIMVNRILSLITIIKESWTDRQREIIWDMMEHQDNQINVAKRLNIKQPAVQKSLAHANFYSYKEAIDTLNTIFDEIRREDV